jgi:hypothetical protein
MLRALLDRLRRRRTPRLGGAWARLTPQELARLAKFPGAYAFTFSSTLEALQRRLEAAGPWDWEMHDSAWYGDYLLALGPDLGRAKGLRVRVYEDEPEPGQFTLEVAFEPEFGTVDVWERVMQTVVDQILPNIGANNIRPTATVD